MDGPGRTRSRTLTEFLNDPESPPGFVYFIDNEPAVQLDLFEKFYTLFWLGPTSPNKFISSFSHIVDDVKSGPPFDQSPTITPAFEGFASVVVDRWAGSMAFPEPQKRPKPARYRRNSQAVGPSDTQSVYRLKERLYAFVEPFTSDAVSVQCDLKATFNNRDYHISLWADTAKSKKDNKETGITSNLPLTESLVSLLSQTCPAASQLPQSDLDLLMRGIRSDISDRRYY